MNLEDILLDTLEYYGADESRYCKTINSCQYSPLSLGLEGVSEGCAIGRLLTPELAFELDKLNVGSINDIESINDDEGEIEGDKSGILPAEVQQKLMKNLDFFSDLQSFHDCKRIINGVLTDYGKSQINGFIRDYNFDRSKFTKWLSND